MVESPSAVLVVGPSWVGDMVMAQVLFRLLKQLQPERAIDVLAPSWSAPLLERMPEVRQAIGMPVGHGEFRWRDRLQLGRHLKGQYQQAILLPNSLKSALIPWFASIPRRTGWRGELRYGLLNDLRRLDQQAYPLMIERFAALALPKGAPMPKPLPRPQLKVEAAGQQAALTRHGLRLDQPVLALCPGAEFGPAKRWPEQHYAALARHYLAQGWQVWLFGSAKDREVCETIAQGAPGTLHDLAGQTSLAEAIDLLSLAQAVVSNDSGLMHVAAALDRPLVALYGSSSPDFTPPLNPNHRTVRLGLACSPCFERTCPLGHQDCLVKLEPQRVIAAMQTLESQGC